MSKIEEVARIIEPQAWAALGIGDTLAYKNRRKSSLRKALAAIRALREPDEGMLVAGQWAGIGSGVATSVWQTLIDAILSSEAGEKP